MIRLLWLVPICGLILFCYLLLGYLAERGQRSRYDAVYGWAR